MIDATEQGTRRIKPQVRKKLLGPQSKIKTARRGMQNLTSNKIVANKAYRGLKLKRAKPKFEQAAKISMQIKICITLCRLLSALNSSKPTATIVPQTNDSH
jgi:hypothetical protein